MIITTGDDFIEMRNRIEELQTKKGYMNNSEHAELTSLRHKIKIIREQQLADALFMQHFNSQTGKSCQNKKSNKDV